MRLAIHLGYGSLLAIFPIQHGSFAAQRRGDIPMCVNAMKGTRDRVPDQNPTATKICWRRSNSALARDLAWLESEEPTATLRVRSETLTPRERKVMTLVVMGRLNTQIAYETWVSEAPSVVDPSFAIFGRFPWEASAARCNGRCRLGAW
jgi:hypothetical protein